MTMTTYDEVGLRLSLPVKIAIHAGDSSPNSKELRSDVLAPVLDTPVGFPDHSEQQSMVPRFSGVAANDGRGRPSEKNHSKYKKRRILFLQRPPSAIIDSTICSMCGADFLQDIISENAFRAYCRGCDHFNRTYAIANLHSVAPSLNGCNGEATNSDDMDRAAIQRQAAVAGFLADPVVAAHRWQVRAARQRARIELSECWLRVFRSWCVVTLCLFLFTTFSGPTMKALRYANDDQLRQFGMILGLWLVVIVTAYLICLDVFATCLDVIYDNTNRSRAYLVFVVSALNGANGEYTGLDDLDHADRQRNRREARNNRHRQGDIGRRRVPEGAAPEVAAAAREVVARAEQPEVAEPVPDRRVTFLYYRNPVTWRLYIILTLFLVIACLHILHSKFSNNIVCMYLSIPCLYVLCKFMVNKGSDRDEFRSMVPFDISSVKVSSFTLRAPNADEILFGGEDFRSRQEVEYCYIMYTTLRIKHPSITANSNTLSILMSTLAIEHRGWVSRYYDLMQNTALVYYQERVRFAARSRAATLDSPAFPIG